MQSGASVSFLLKLIASLSLNSMNRSRNSLASYALLSDRACKLATTVGRRDIGFTPTSLSLSYTLSHMYSNSASLVQLLGTANACKNPLGTNS